MMKALTPGEVSETEGESGTGDEGGDPLFEEQRLWSLKLKKRAHP